MSAPVQLLEPVRCELSSRYFAHTEIFTLTYFVFLSEKLSYSDPVSMVDGRPMRNALIGLVCSGVAWRIVELDGASTPKVECLRQGRSISVRWKTKQKKQTSFASTSNIIIIIITFFFH